MHIVTPFFGNIMEDNMKDNMKDPENKVVYFNGYTRLDLPAQQVLEQAVENNEFEHVIILGRLKDPDNTYNTREFYFASTYGTVKDVLWELEIAKGILLE